MSRSADQTKFLRGIDSPIGSPNGSDSVILPGIVELVGTGTEPLPSLIPLA